MESSFLLSAVIALTAVYLRHGIKETEDFCEAKENNELFTVPIAAAWLNNKAGLACTAAFSILVSVFGYTRNIYYRTIAVSGGGLPERASRESNFLHFIGKNNIAALQRVINSH